MRPIPQSPALAAAVTPEGATLDSTRLLELGFELAVTPTALMTGLGVYLCVNSALAALLGREASWFVGRSFLGIIRSHKGGIAIRSTVGRGTTVSVNLPTIERTARISPTPTPGNMRAIRGDGHILLADDEAAVRQVATISLERAGCIVTQCHDGAEAVRVFQADPATWRAVVLDLTMPNLGGQDALLAMGAIRDDVPAVLCSGYASEELSVKVTTLANVIFVQKPFTAGRLTTALFEVAPPS